MRELVCQLPAHNSTPVILYSEYPYNVIKREGKVALRQQSKFSPVFFRSLADGITSPRQKKLSFTYFDELILQIQ